MLEVDSIAQGGRGVARANGYVVFVSGALPGDRVRARLTKAKRDFAEAQAVELVDPSPDRVADRCLHDGEPCPGAPWQGLPYERQLDEKAEQVDAALRRLGGLDGFELEPAEPAAQPVALPQQARVLVRRARRRSWRSASTAAAAGPR